MLIYGTSKCGRIGMLWLQYERGGIMLFACCGRAVRVPCKEWPLHIGCGGGFLGIPLGIPTLASMPAGIC